MENTNIEFNKLDSTEDIVEAPAETVEAPVEDLPVADEVEVLEKIETVEKADIPLVKESKPKKTETKAETPKEVAVYSERNLYKYELGELLKGYSILPAAKADKWVASTKKVRIATPEEVARYYNA